MFSIRSATRNETVGPLVKKAREILADIKKGNISEEEVRTAKEYLVGGFPLGVATLNDIASRWLTGYRFGLGPEFLNGFIPRVSAVTREEVIAAARKHIDPWKLTIVVAGQGPAVEASLKSAGFARVKRITPRDLMN
jgi:predicted Zn-dependent peptidase